MYQHISNSRQTADYQLSVDQLLADKWPTVGWQTTDSIFWELFFTFTDTHGAPLHFDSTPLDLPLSLHTFSFNRNKLHVLWSPKVTALVTFGFSSLFKRVGIVGGLLLWVAKTSTEHDSIHFNIPVHCNFAKYLHKHQ